MCVLVTSAHTCVLLTLRASSPQHPLCALQNATFRGTKMKIRCSNLKKPQGSVSYRPQIAKHIIDASFYVNYGMIIVLSIFTLMCKQPPEYVFPCKTEILYPLNKFPFSSINPWNPPFNFSSL